MLTSLHAHRGPRDIFEDAARTVTVGALPNLTDFATGLVIGDGVGAQPHGEVASTLAVSDVATFTAAWLGTGLPEKLDDAELRRTLADRLRDTNTLILAAAENDPVLSGMATTIVCAVILGNRLLLGWAGDSRCYLYQGQDLRQLTCDHSCVQDLIECGELTRAEAARHPAAHTINRYLGQSKGFNPETQIVPVSPGDVVLLCTDGLTDVVGDMHICGVIRDAVEGNQSFDTIAQRLVENALQAGTTDNVTIIATQIGNPACYLTRRTATSAYPCIVAGNLGFKKEETDYVDACTQYDQDRRVELAMSGV